jgi:hypothetical protein
MLHPGVIWASTGCRETARRKHFLSGCVRACYDGQQGFPALSAVPIAEVSNNLLSQLMTPSRRCHMKAADGLMPDASHANDFAVFSFGDAEMAALALISLRELMHVGVQGRIRRSLQAFEMRLEQGQDMQGVGRNGRADPNGQWLALIHRLPSLRIIRVLTRQNPIYGGRIS